MAAPHVRLPDNTQSILIIGKNGSGKTRGAVWHLAQRDLENECWIVINHKREALINSIPGAVFLELDERPERDAIGVFIYQPRPEIDDEAVDAILWHVYENGRIGVYVDEGYMISPRSAPLNALYTQGRSKEVPMITLSQRPARISRFAVSEAMFYQVYVLTDKRDRKTIAEFMPVDLDEFMVPQGGRPRLLAPYHSLYYDTREDSPVLMRPVPGDDEILSQIAEKLLPPEQDGAFNLDDMSTSSPRNNEKPLSKLKLI